MSAQNNTQNETFLIKEEPEEEEYYETSNLEIANTYSKEENEIFRALKTELQEDVDNELQRANEYNLNDLDMDGAFLEMLAMDIPSMINRSEVTAMFPLHEELPSNSRRPVRERRNDRKTAKKRKREDCLRCVEHKKLKTFMQIEHLQLINYKMKLEITGLERKLGITPSYFPTNEGAGLNED